MICERHGRLKRACEFCDTEQELAEARDKIRQTEIQRDNCRTSALEWKAKVHKWQEIIEAHNAKISPYETYNTQHWCWMPDEENYLETLSAPVLIPAEWLRNLLEEAYEKGKEETLKSK